MTSKSQQPAQYAVYTTMRKSILTLNLLPGTAISENEISQRFEVSRTPVRETFIQLAKESLIQIRPQKDTLVSLIDINRMKQEYFLRKSLEFAVLEPFIKYAKDSDFIKMQQLIDMQKRCLEKKDFISFIEYDDLFHKVIFDTVCQSFSWEITENFCGHYYRIRLLSTRLNQIASDIIEQHIGLLESFKSKDLKGAQTKFDAHLYKVDSEIDNLIKLFPDYFAKEQKKDVFDVDFGGLHLKGSSKNFSIRQFL